MLFTGWIESGLGSTRNPT